MESTGGCEVSFTLPRGYTLPAILEMRLKDPEFLARVLDLGSVAATAVEGHVSEGGLAPRDIDSVASEVYKRLHPEIQDTRKRVYDAHVATISVGASVSGVVRAFGGSAAEGTIGSAGERGAAGEELLAEAVLHHFPSGELVHVAAEARRGDFQLKLPGTVRKGSGGAAAPPDTEGVTILLESKNVKRVTSQDVAKFQRDLASSEVEGVACGLFVSLQPGTVPHRGTFAIEASSGSRLPAVYVGNVLADLGSDGHFLKMAVTVAAFLGRAWTKSRTAGGSEEKEVRQRALAIAQMATDAFQAQTTGLRSARRHVAQLGDVISKMEAAISEGTARLAVLSEGL